jgi:uncharacterized protein DUF1579
MSRRGWHRTSAGHRLQKDVEMKTRHRILHAALACALLTFATTASAQDRNRHRKRPPRRTPAAGDDGCLAEGRLARSAARAAGRALRGHLGHQADHVEGPVSAADDRDGKSVDTAVLGGRQIHTQFSNRFLSQPFNGIDFMGYDNVRGKYTASWIDDIHRLHDQRRRLRSGDEHLHFVAEMADPMKDGAPVRIRESVRIIDADHVMEMFEARDGHDVCTMQIDHTRAK